MIGTLIGAGIGAASSIFGGIKARQAAKRADRMLQQQKADNQAWYDRRYNEDATQRADAQRMLQIVMDRMKRHNSAAAGRAAVMGASEESVANEKAAGAMMLADTASQIAASGASRQDQIDSQFRQQDNALTAQQINNTQGQAANIANATAAAGQAMANAGAAVDEWREAGKNRDFWSNFWSNKKNSGIV